MIPGTKHKAQETTDLATNKHKALREYAAEEEKPSAFGKAQQDKTWAPGIDVNWHKPT